MTRSVRRWNRRSKMALAASGSSSGSRVIVPVAQATNIVTVSAPSASATTRGQTPCSTAGGAAHSTSAVGCTAARTSAPAVASCSRSCSRGRRSRTAFCRLVTSARPAGSRSQVARVSSPARVCAVLSSWNSEPSPNRSRSWAKRWSASANRSPRTPVPLQRSSSRAIPCSYHATARATRSRASNTRSCSTTSPMNTPSGTLSHQLDIQPPNTVPQTRPAPTAKVASRAVLT